MIPNLDWLIRLPFRFLSPNFVWQPVALDPNKQGEEWTLCNWTDQVKPDNFSTKAMNGQAVILHESSASMSVLVCIYVDLLKVLNELSQLYRDYYPSALLNERSRFSPSCFIVCCIFRFFTLLYLYFCFYYLRLHWI